MWVLPGYPFTLILIPTTISVGIYCISIFSKWNPSALRLAITNFIFIYLLIVFSVYVYETYLEYVVATFDLDGDGFFSSEESTTEYAVYSSKLTNDVGRNFAPITGFAFSFLCSVIFFIIIKLKEIVMK